MIHSTIVALVNDARGYRFTVIQHCMGRATGKAWDAHYGSYYTLESAQAAQKKLEAKLRKATKG